MALCVCSFFKQTLLKYFRGIYLLNSIFKPVEGLEETYLKILTTESKFVLKNEKSFYGVFIQLSRKRRSEPKIIAF